MLNVATPVLNVATPVLNVATPVSPRDTPCDDVILSPEAHQAQFLYTQLFHTEPSFAGTNAQFGDLQYGKSWRH